MTRREYADMVDTVEGILLDEERGEFGANGTRWLAKTIVGALAPVPCMHLDEEEAACDFCGQAQGHSNRCSVTKFGVNPKPPYAGASREEDAKW